MLFRSEITDISHEDDRRFVVTIRNDLEEKSYLTEYGQQLRVKVGDVLKAGDRITEGAVHPRELLAVSNVTAVQNYLLNEVQKVYRISASVRISDKHLEIIINQMLNRVYVIDGGETALLPGQRLTTHQFTRANKEALISGKRPAVATPLILGIKASALASDSFLSAASFQETTRILTDATIKGKLDPLMGLKENVITGRLIPAGRGILSREEQAELLEDFSVADTLDKIKKSYRNTSE